MTELKAKEKIDRPILSREIIQKYLVQNIYLKGSAYPLTVKVIQTTKEINGMSECVIMVGRNRSTITTCSIELPFVNEDMTLANVYGKIKAIPYMALYPDAIVTGSFAKGHSVRIPYAFYRQPDKKGQATDPWIEFQVKASSVLYNGKELDDFSVRKIQLPRPTRHGYHRLSTVSAFHNMVRVQETHQGSDPQMPVSWHVVRPDRLIISIINHHLPSMVLMAADNTPNLDLKFRNRIRRYISDYMFGPDDKQGRVLMPWYGSSQKQFYDIAILRQFFTMDSKDTGFLSPKYTILNERIVKKESIGLS